MKTKQALLVYYNVIYGRFFPLFNVTHSRTNASAHTHIQTRIYYARCSYCCLFLNMFRMEATTNGAAVTAELKYYVNSTILICPRSKYVYHMHLHFFSIYRWYLCVSVVLAFCDFLRFFVGFLLLSLRRRQSHAHTHNANTCGYTIYKLDE